MPEIGFCGDDCRLCPRYIATMSGSVDKLNEVAAMWERVGWRDNVVSPEEIKCNGCKTVKWCRYNELRECAQGREISN